MEQLARVQDAVRLLGVTPETIRRYEKDGKLPKARRHPMNGYRVWDYAELVAACERLKSQAATKPQAPA